MLKVSCLFLLLITIGNCSTHDGLDTSLTESSRNDRNYENRKESLDANSADYIEDSGPHDEDYPTRVDTSRSEGGKLLGNWRNNGAAFEPKWRDGDSVPLVPFNAAKQTRPDRHEVLGEGSKLRDWDSSHGVTKAYTRHDVDDDDVGRTLTRVEESVVDTIDEMLPGPIKYSPPLPHVHRGTKDRYTAEKDYESKSRYRTEHESEIVPRGRKPRPATVLTDELRYETAEDLDASGRSAKRGQKPYRHEEEAAEDSIAKSRYRETFQVHPNEYELNDEEYQKPRPRKRRPPQHYEFSEFRAPTYSVTWSTERYESTASSNFARPSTMRPEISTRRRPEQKNSSIRRDRNKAAGMDAQRVSENAELKSLLKMQQIEGLSLSELLQRRNLTLNDLLKGKADVLNALKFSDSNEDSMEFSSIKPKIFESIKVLTTTERPKWMPSQPPRQKIVDSKPNEVLASFLPKTQDEVSKNLTTKNSNEPEPEGEDSLEKLDSAETEDGQRKSNDNEKLSAIVRLTKPIILPRLTSLADKSAIFTTTTTTTTASEDEVTKDIELAYQNDQSAGKIEKTSASLEEDEIMEFSDFPMKKHFPITTMNSPTETTTKFDETDEEDSGSTLSIEHILSPTEQTSTVQPATTQNPLSFDNNKVNNVVAETAHAKETDTFGSFEYQSDDPHEVVEEVELDEDEELPLGDQPYENFSENPETSDESSGEETLFKNHQIFSTSSKPYEVVVSEIEPDARAEIFELFSSSSSAKRLERLLKSRNMSIDELIALRQRGSSKVHMAEVLRSRETLSSRSRKTSSGRNENNEQPGIDEEEEVRRMTEKSLMRETTAMDSADDLSDIEIDANSEEEIVPSTTERQTFTTEENTNIYSIGTERGAPGSTTEQNMRKHVQLLDLLTAFDSLPFSMRPNLDSSSTARPNERIEETTRILSEIEDRRVQEEDQAEKTNSSGESTSFVEIGLVEEILKEDSIPSGELENDSNVSTNYSSGPFGEDRKISSRVRPSIIASGAILGVTIVVFLAIFIVCRIRQKQKYTYRNTFSRAVFQGPVMTARKLSNTSSLNTIMVNVVATSTTKRPERRETQEIDDDFEFKSDIENDSLDANDSWDTIPDFMK